MIRRVLLAAVVAGAVAGITLTALQSMAVTPLLFAAEGYEVSASGAGPVPHRHGGLDHSHARGDRAHGHDGQALVPGSEGAAPAASGAEDGTAVRAAGEGKDRGPGRDTNSHAEGHQHDHGGAWAPHDGLERTFWTGVSNVATAIGFALLLVTVFAWRGGATLRQGLLWGAAGFFVFFVNPAIGIRPELPGAFAADLLDRQLWWLLAVACSAAGVGLLIFAPKALAKVGGAAFLVVPHLAGAPHPEVEGGLAPGSLADSFVVASAATNAAFWLVLGLAASVAFTRFSRI